MKRLENLTIIVDTREKENKNILQYLSNKNISYIRRKLDFGDYSYMIDDLSYENEFSIERKMSLTELSGNIAQYRDRFERELQRAKESNAKLILLVENGSYDDILQHNYKTELTEKSYIASLFSFSNRYNLDINFINKKYAGLFIYHACYYHARERLKESEYETKNA